VVEMAERRIGLIPNATTNARGADDECAILATDRRLIVTFEKPQIRFKQGLRNYFGKEADAPPIPPATVDYATVDLDQLGKMPQNVVIPYFVVEKFALHMTLGVASIDVKYRNEAGKSLTFTAILVPSEPLIKKNKMEGIRRRDTIKKYGQKCQELFKRALPSSLSQNTEWMS